MNSFIHWTTKSPNTNFKTQTTRKCRYANVKDEFGTVEKALRQCDNADSALR